MKNDRVCDFCLAPKFAIVWLYSCGEQGVSDFCLALKVAIVLLFSCREQGVSDFCLAPKFAIVLLYSCREQVVFQWNDVFFSVYIRSTRLIFIVLAHWNNG